MTAKAMLWLGGLALFLPSCALAAPEDIPLNNPDGWQVLEYSSLPAHKVKFGADGLSIEVDKSASPIIYPLTPRTVAKVSVDLVVEGELRLKPNRQGEEGNDDFLMRLGIVYEGDQTLGFFQRAVAPAWITTLFDLAPEGTGVDRIQFFTVFSDPRLENTERVHPLAELMSEKNALFAPARNDKPRELKLEFTSEGDRKVLALWISTDGDDTASNFKVRIRRLLLQ